MTTDLETRSMLRDTLERFSLERYTFQDRLRYLSQPGGFSEEAWESLTEFGFLGLCLEEEHGGINADSATVGALMEVYGRRLMQEPFLNTAVLGATALNASEEGGDYLEDLVSGRSVLGWAIDSATDCKLTLKGAKLSGEVKGGVHGDVATHMLAPVTSDGGLKLVIVDLSDESISRDSYYLVDGRGAANINFREADCVPLSFGEVSAEKVVRRLLDQGALALCAEALGVISALIEQTNDYLKVRKQFGRPLGSNQVLQHRMADLYILQQEAVALTRKAELAFDASSDRQDMLISAAKAWVGRAVQKVANEAVQMHGGLGITEELEISHYFRRAMVINTLFGSRDEHMTRFASRIFNAA